MKIIVENFRYESQWCFQENKISNERPKPAINESPGYLGMDTPQEKIAQYSGKKSLQISHLEATIHFVYWIGFKCICLSH